jgi:HK97 family phage prohead protease
MKFLTTTSTQIKSLTDQGEISGYASVFNIVDGYGDIVVKGSFKNTIKNFNLGKKPKLLWQHDKSIPIGVIDELREDNYGLFIKSHLLLEIPKAREIYSLLKNKVIDGFSIGYKVKDSFFESGIQYLTDIDLMEISIVTFPACEGALVGDVKSQNDGSCNDLDKNICNDGGDKECIYKIRQISNKINNIIKGRYGYGQ